MELLLEDELTRHENACFDSMITTDKDRHNQKEILMDELVQYKQKEYR